jgi:hypothetical protein
VRLQDDVKQLEPAGGSGLPRTERLDGPPERIVLHPCGDGDGGHQAFTVMRAKFT